jgi:hypothetical protein
MKKSPTVEHLPNADASRPSSMAACVCDYQLAGRVMEITHTGVPPAVEGRGIAAELVAAALAHARANGWKVRPICSYVQAYMRRHPETLDLLA